MNDFGLQQFFSSHGRDRQYFIAYSGGLDSHTLLSLCAKMRIIFPDLKLLAIHVNHGISSNANLWETHCQQVCEKLNIRYIAKKANIPLVKGESLEANARQARYDIFKHLLTKDDYLLTAHHIDDQAETVFLQLFRGAGSKGLSAMPVIKKLGKGWQYRPLLSVCRDELWNYANLNHLTWIQDESNLNVNFTRNFVRQQLMPLLKSKWPTISRAIARSARHCAETEKVLDGFLTEELVSFQGKLPNSLSISLLKNRDEAFQRLILRTFIRKHTAILPNTKKLSIIIKQMMDARWDRMPLVSWKKYEMRRYGDNLYLLKAFSKELPHLCHWDFEAPLFIENLGTLSANQVKGNGLKKEIGQIQVRFRQGGEKIFLGSHHHTLKNLFQEWKVPPWERNRIPLVFKADELICVLGYAIDPRFKVKDQSENGIAVFLTPLNPDFYADNADRGVVNI